MKMNFIIEIDLVYERFWGKSDNQVIDAKSKQTEFSIESLSKCVGFLNEITLEETKPVLM